MLSAGSHKEDHKSRDLLRVGSNDLQIFSLKSFEPTLNRSHDLWLILNPVLMPQLQPHYHNHNHNFNRNDNNDNSNRNNDHNNNKNDHNDRR